jgi:hypothetical protein
MLTAEDVLLRNRVLLYKLSADLIEYETVDARHPANLISLPLGQQGVQGREPVQGDREAHVPARHPGDVQGAPALKPPPQGRWGGEGGEGRAYRGLILGFQSPGDLQSLQRKQRKKSEPDLGIQATSPRVPPHLSLARDGFRT